MPEGGGGVIGKCGCKSQTRITDSQNSLQKMHARIHGQAILALLRCQISEIDAYTTLCLLSGSRNNDASIVFDQINWIRRPIVVVCLIETIAETFSSSRK